MTAGTSWQQIANSMYERGKRKLLEFASGKAAPGTVESINEQIAKAQAEKWLNEIKSQKTLTSQEEAAANLDLLQKARTLNTDENLRGVRNLIPYAMQAYEGRTGTDTRAFGDRTRAVTDSQLELGKANTDQQAALTRTYGSEVLDRVGNLQERMFNRAQDTRDMALNQIMGLTNRSVDADIAYRNQLLDFQKQQNSGLQGFLGNIVLPVAQLGLAAKALWS